MIRRFYDVSQIGRKKVFPFGEMQNLFIIKDNELKKKHKINQIPNV